MKRTYIIEIISGIVDKQSAEMIVERLEEEGVLHLGYGDADVDKVVTKFVDTFGTTKTSKLDRFAAHRLTRRYGSQAVVGIIGLLGAMSQEKYAPTVGSIAQLEDKWVSVLNFLRKQKGNEEIDV